MSADNLLYIEIITDRSENKNTFWTGQVHLSLHVNLSTYREVNYKLQIILNLCESDFLYSTINWSLPYINFPADSHILSFHQLLEIEPQPIKGGYWSHTTISVQTTWRQRTNPTTYIARRAAGSKFTSPRSQCTAEEGRPFNTMFSVNDFMIINIQANHWKRCKVSYGTCLHDLFF